MVLIPYLNCLCSVLSSAAYIAHVMDIVSCLNYSSSELSSLPTLRMFWTKFPVYTAHVDDD